MLEPGSGGVTPCSRADSVGLGGRSGDPIPGRSQPSAKAASPQGVLRRAQPQCCQGSREDFLEELAFQWVPEAGRGPWVGVLGRKEVWVGCRDRQRDPRGSTF